MSALKFSDKVYSANKKFGIELAIDDIDSHEEARQLLMYIAQQFTNHVNAHGGTVDVVGKSPAMGGVLQLPVG